MRKFGAFLLFLACRAEQLPVKRYTTADGLAGNRVECILRDSHGFLWFGTTEGLSRFDGYQFTNFTAAQGLPASSVNQIIETRSGVYWIATGRGPCRFDRPGTPGLVLRSTRRPALQPRWWKIGAVPSGAARFRVCCASRAEEGRSSPWISGCRWRQAMMAPLSAHYSRTAKALFGSALAGRSIAARWMATSGAIRLAMGCLASSGSLKRSLRTARDKSGSPPDRGCGVRIPTRRWTARRSRKSTTATTGYRDRRGLLHCSRLPTASFGPAQAD